MSATDPAAPSGDGQTGLPRIVGTWRAAYVLVLAALVVDVALLCLLGWMYA